MSGYKNRNRSRDRHWREPRQDGLLGCAPRTPYGRQQQQQQQQGLLGGGPHNPAMGAVHRPNPWESGMMPGNRALPPAMSRNQAVWGGNAPQPPSLLGTPDIMGGGGGAGLLGGVPQDSTTIMGINQLARMNSREAKMALNIIDTVLAPQQGPPGPRYGQFQHKIGHLDRGKMARGRGRDSSRSGGGGGGGGGSANDLRKWLKDKRGLTCPRPSSRQFAASSSSQPGHRSGGSSSASSSRKDRPDSSRGSSPAKTGDDKDAEAEEKCPVEALRCHVCNVDQFSSLASFKQHLRSSPHEEMLSALYRKNSAVLDLLRQQSKIAAMQQTLAATVDDKEPKKSQCYKCFCKVPGSLQKHIASVEHKLVNNFQIVKCCNVWFSSRPDYEQHQLGFRHLLTKYEEKQQKLSDDQKTEIKEEVKEEEDGDSDEAGSEWWGPAERALKNLHRASQAAEPLTSASLSPYTGLSPVGESFVQCRASLECSACDERFDPSAADLHCRSNAHYLHVLNALKAKDAREAAAAQPASEKLSDDELAKSRESTSLNQSSPSNSSAVKPESSHPSDCDADEGNVQQKHSAQERLGDDGDYRERDGAFDTRELDGQQDDPDEDEDERMIYEGLNDEPQLEFDDEDEEELHDDDDHDGVSKKSDRNMTPELGNATEEAFEEPSLGDGSEKLSGVNDEDLHDASHHAREGDEQNVDQSEQDSIDNRDEKRPEEQGSADRTKSDQDKDLDPASPSEVREDETASAPADADNNLEQDSSANDCKTKLQEQEIVSVKEGESQEVQGGEDPDLQSSAASESEREEVQTAESPSTRRSGRASRKRAATADDGAEELRLAEPAPKRGRGRGRGRGGRK